VGNPLKLAAMHWAYPSVHGVRIQMRLSKGQTMGPYGGIPFLRGFIGVDGQEHLVQPCCHKLGSSQRNAPEAEPSVKDILDGIRHALNLRTDLEVGLQDIVDLDT
jgi:hypothetical protein